MERYNKDAKGMHLLCFCIYGLLRQWKQQRRIERVKDDWRLGMNMSVNFPLYSGNSLSTAQEQAELAKRKTENDYLTYLNDLKFN